MRANTFHGYLVLIVPTLCFEWKLRESIRTPQYWEIDTFFPFLPALEVLNPTAVICLPYEVQQFASNMSSTNLVETLVFFQRNFSVEK